MEQWRNQQKSAVIFPEWASSTGQKYNYYRLKIM